MFLLCVDINYWYVSMNDICKELVQFLRLSTRIEIKLTATKNVLSLTGSSEGRKFILDNNNLLEVQIIQSLMV